MDMSIIKSSLDIKTLAKYDRSLGIPLESFISDSNVM